MVCLLCGLNSFRATVRCDRTTSNQGHVRHVSSPRAKELLLAWHKSPGYLMGEKRRVKRSDSWEALEGKSSKKCSCKKSVFSVLFLTIGHVHTLPSRKL